MTRRKYNVEQRRRDLCDAAIELVAAEGGRGVTHLRVDRHAGFPDDVETDLATLESSGMTVEVKSYNPDGSGTLLWAYAKGSEDPRIEWSAAT